MKKPVSKVHSGYNFVPLSAFIYQPEWADQASRDIPFADGLNGVLSYKLRAYTPLLVGGTQIPSDGVKPGKTKPFLLPDGTPGIPGSSLKGMCRGQMKIATFGKMNDVDDRWLSIRDLTDGAKEMYRDRLRNETEKFKLRVKAGFLRPVGQGDDFCWELIPCEFKRVSQNDLISWASERTPKSAYEIKNRQSAVSKYQIWGDNLDVTFRTIRPEKGKKTKAVTQEHEKAHYLGQGDKKGRIVFTGQPQPNDGRKGSKYLEFIFYNPHGSCPVEEEVIRAFLHIHGDTPEWKFWKKRFKTHLGAPVFYLDRAGFPTHIGLAMMFRLAYTQSIGQAVDYTHFGHRDDGYRDLPETLFGHINDNDAGLAGRVSFSTARLVGKREDHDAFVTLLNGPKPSYFPAYIQQEHDEDGELQGKRFKSLMDTDVEIRGWKRYPVRKSLSNTEPPKDVKSKKVLMKLNPLAAGSQFEGRIRLHNVRPVELGALLWSLTWGDNPNLRHGLGMGKPFGMGQVGIEVEKEGWTLTRNDGGEVPDFQTCLKLFEEQMETAYQAAVAEHGLGTGTWRESEQMFQLMSMADPDLAPGLPGSLDYMDRDRFAQSKGPRKDSPRKVLLPYAGREGQSGPSRDPFRGKRREDWERYEIKSKAKSARERLLTRQRLQEAELAREREAALAHLSPLERELVEDLDQPDAENRAVNWLKRLDAYGEEDARLIALKLRDFYIARKKWKGKQTKKQQEKIKQLQAILKD